MPLKTELEYIRLYLQIEQTRLQDRLEVALRRSTPEALDAAVPNLLLLPLVESAIANGVSVRPGARASRSARGRTTAICASRCTRSRSRHSRRVPPAVHIDDSFVRKTKLRLELLYPGRHRVAISDRLEKGHEVAVPLPLADAPRSLPSEGAA